MNCSTISEAGGRNQRPPTSNHNPEHRRLAAMAGHHHTSGKTQFINLTGRRFGRLTVLQRAPNQGASTMWFCDCVCGRRVRVRREHLKIGRVVSCGCLKTERIGRLRLKHGASESSEFKSWASAKQRCFNPKNKGYKYWGGRGITMCDRWRDSFAAFIEDMGSRPKGLSLDRINNDGNYEPGNCRWTDRITQRRNSRKRVRRR